MSLETDVRAKLVATSAVTTLCGTRIYPLQLPQGATMPAVTYQRISGPRVQELGGPGHFGTARLQLDAWGESYAAAQSLAAAIRVALNGFVGDLGSSRAVVRLDNERDWYEDEVSLYRVIQDYRILHSE